MLILPIHEYGRSFHLLRSSSISLFRDLKFLSYRSFTCLVRVTPSYFILFVILWRVFFPCFFSRHVYPWALVKFLLWMWNMYHRHSELIVHLGRFYLWWVSLLVFIAVSWEVLPLLDKFRGEWLPPAIRLSTSSPMEELERGPKKLKWFAAP